MLSKTVTALPSPPSELFVVSTSRVRAGKGPMRITPVGWFEAYGGVRGGVLAKVAGKENIYPFTDCFIDADAAAAGVHNVAEREHNHAKRKLNALVSKLNQAKKAVAQSKP